MEISTIVLLSIFLGTDLLIAFFNNFRYVSDFNDQVYHLEQAVEIYDIINDTLAKTNATRFFIFTTHNGDGIPSLHKPFKVTSLYGTSQNKDTKSLYKNLSVDEDYTRMLLEIKKDQEVFGPSYQIKNLDIFQPKSMLRKIYEVEGIKVANIYYLTTTNYGMMYCSVSSDNMDTWDSNDEVEFCLSVDKLKKKFVTYVTYSSRWNRIFRFIKSKLKFK